MVVDLLCLCWDGQKGDRNASNGRQLRDLGTTEAVEDGVLTRMDDTEQDLICFHMDDSARILHIAEGRCR